MTLAYSVYTETDDPALADRWVAWLLGGHIRKVLDAGAVAAEVTRAAPDAQGVHRIESRYEFADAAAFAKYEKEYAPTLRADGPREVVGYASLKMTRAVREVVATFKR